MIQGLKTGDIVYTRMPFVWYKPLRYVSWAIRKVLKTWYNHIAIVVFIWGKPYVAESTSGGVKITPLLEWIRDYKLIIKRPKSLLSEKKIASRIMEYQGFTGYDYISLVWYQLILQITGKWHGKERDAADDKLYCSEYAALVYKEQFPEWWKTTPKDLFEKLEQEVVYSDVSK